MVLQSCAFRREGNQHARESTKAIQIRRGGTMRLRSFGRACTQKDVLRSARAKAGSNCARCTHWPNRRRTQNTLGCLAARRKLEAGCPLRPLSFSPKASSFSFTPKLERVGPIRLRGFSSQLRLISASSPNNHAASAFSGTAAVAVSGNRFQKVLADGQVQLFGG